MRTQDAWEQQRARCFGRMGAAHRLERHDLPFEVGKTGGHDWFGERRRRGGERQAGLAQRYIPRRLNGGENTRGKGQR